MSSLTEVLTIEQITKATETANYVLQYGDDGDCSAISTYGRFVMSEKSAPESVRADFIEAAIRALPNTVDALLADLYPQESAAFLDYVARVVYACRRLV